MWPAGAPRQFVRGLLSAAIDEAVSEGDERDPSSIAFRPGPGCSPGLSGLVATCLARLGVPCALNGTHGLLLPGSSASLLREEMGLLRCWGDESD